MDAGATRAISQFFFDTDAFLRFVERARRRGSTIPILPGVMPVTNFKGLRTHGGAVRHELPAWLATLFEGLDDDPDTRRLVAVPVAAEMCAKLEEEGFTDFHFYTLNRADLVYAICRDAGRARARGGGGMKPLDPRRRWLSPPALFRPPGPRPPRPSAWSATCTRSAARASRPSLLDTPAGVVLLDAGDGRLRAARAREPEGDRRAALGREGDLLAQPRPLRPRGRPGRPAPRDTGAKVEVMAQDVKADETGTYAGYERQGGLPLPAGDGRSRAA